MTRSIFVNILCWFALTLIVCVAGLSLTNQWRNRFEPGRRDFFSRSLSWQVSDARTAYEEGGKAALARHFLRMHEFLPGNHALVDQSGIDLVTGENRSAELGRLGPQWSPATDGGRMQIAWPTRDGKYRMIVNAPAPVGPWSSLPAYLWIGLAAVAFCYILAVQFAQPLRTLEQTVLKFGGGDLSARAETRRRDEFGKLAQSFNLMAERIETLLNADRRLLQDVSHELRSPLARLEFAVELARSGSDHNRSMDRIKKEVDRLSTLVSELLQVTRAETDPASRNLELLDLRELIESVKDDSVVEADPRAVRLEFLTGRDNIHTNGDRELLRRAVENVVRNAIRYAPMHSTVEICLDRQAENALISVRDFGPGVAADSLPHLFKPFFRAEPDRNRNSGGVGLGLSIAQRAVAVHGGEITATNANPGLRVEMKLPAAVPASPALKMFVTHS